jgi:hypothetical protein
MTPEQREADAEDLYNRAMQRLLEPPGEDEVSVGGQEISDVSLRAARRLTA